jgi:DNA-binding transcriptional LysR family regulator
MELRQLRYFIKVAETLHFSQAAEQLHIAQQPLSFQIKQLETELGLKLFERTTRSVKLTPAGEALLVEVKAGLGRIERGVELAQHIAQGREGKISIGCTNNIIYNLMPPIFREFRKSFPLIEVVLAEQSDLQTLESKLFNEEIDFGIIELIGANVPGLIYEPFYTENGVIALPRDHPLARLKALSLRELKNQPFVMFSRREQHEVFDLVISLCQQAGFSPVIVQEAATTSAIISLVASGMGVSLVTNGFSDFHTDEVAYRPLIEPSLEIEVALIWKEGRQLPWLPDLRRISHEVAQRLSANEEHQGTFTGRDRRRGGGR